MSEAELLASMSPEELARTPAGEPPPGVVPNLEDPPSIGYRLLIIGAILLAIMIICSTLRFYSVIAVRRKIRPDDCMCYSQWSCNISLMNWQAQHSWLL